MANNFLTRSLIAAMAFALAACFVPKALAQNDLPEAGVSEAGAVKDVDYAKLKSPVPYTKRSISRGRMIFMRYCTDCHGRDGKALVDVVANATNLTAPERWLHGTKEGEIFKSIRDGAGVDMPPFKVQLKREEDMWHLVNYIRSLWPADKQPKLQEDKKATGGEADGSKESSARKGEGHEGTSGR